MAEKSIEQYFKTLGVAPGASKKEIETAYKYKKKIFRYEPSDNLVSNSNMKPYLLAELQEIDEAYQKIIAHQTNISTASDSSSKFNNRDEYEAWKTAKINESQTQQSTPNDNGPYYQILGLKSSASKEEIKQAYKDLLNVWNPDRFSNEPSLQQKAQRTIKEIDEAYEKLILHFATDVSKTTQVSSDLKSSKTPFNSNTPKVATVSKSTNKSDQNKAAQRSQSSSKPQPQPEYKKGKGSFASIFIASFLTLVIYKLLNSNGIYLGFLPAVLV